jgi:flagellin
MSIFTINHNIPSLNAQRNINNTSLGLSKSLQKLSSGLRINTGADGPADLVISEQMRADIGATKMAVRNTQEAMGLLGSADGALGEVSQLLTDLKSRVIHATNSGLVSAAQIAADQAEYDDAVGAINRILGKTNYAGKKVFFAGATDTRVFQIGPNTGDTFSLTTEIVSTAHGLVAATNHVSAIATLGLVSTAIQTVATQRGKIGTTMKGILQSNINTLDVGVENLTAAESYIRDTNMAEEISNYTKQQILVQAGMSVLAQANVSSQSVLQLLR